MNAVALSHGFLAISDIDAHKLNGGSVPDCGYEALVQRDGQWFWMQRTTLTSEEMRKLGYGRRWSWTIRPTHWKMESGRAVLR